MDDPQIIPYVLYRDAGAAMDWLSRVFGASERERKLNDDGTVNHGEMVFSAGGVVMVGSPGADFRTPAELGAVTQTACVEVDDLEAYRARALEAGAEPTPIVERSYGQRMYSVDDLEGQRWYVTQHMD